MQFANVNGVKSHPAPSLKGLCYCCGSEVISKCGNFNIWHWAHKNLKHCDNWWEPETEWHRNWKSKFPNEWQEIILIDESANEKHIADVRTINNLVIEFQHSHINPDERISRENFYKNMIWVVDGTRLKRDFPRFLKGKLNEFENTIFYDTDNPNIFKVDLIDWCLPLNWLKSSVPVIFDFLGNESFPSTDNLRNKLYCLFPQVGKYARIAEISREAFIKSVTIGDWVCRAKNFTDSFLLEEKAEEAKFKKQNLSISSKRYYLPIIRRRRF